MIDVLLQRARDESDPPYHRRVFVNRNLRLETIDVLCFDLDWTLAAYAREPLQRLIFDKAIAWLRHRHVYSKDIEKASFVPEFAHRGLLLDKPKGIVLKMDRHRYVGRAFKGRRALSSAERLALYRHERVDLSRSRFYNVDTLFELAEVNLYSELVELAAATKDDTAKTFEEMAADVRAAVDGVHHDGSLKRDILARPSDYVPVDPEIPLVIKKMALSGKRVVLISNSEWYYTNAICAHLFDGVPGAGWRTLFDLVVVDAQKPSFFGRGRPFIELDEGGAEVATTSQPEWGKVYSQGSRDGLDRLLGVRGERVLYIGDHIYSDIVTPKLQSTWRTMLILSELEHELMVLKHMVEEVGRLNKMQSAINEIGQRLDSARDLAMLTSQLSLAEREEAPDDSVEQLNRTHYLLRRQARVIDQRIAHAFNRYWGSVFKQGSSKSLFGSQVEDFACLYTSRVSNLLFYGNSHYFRVNSDPMPHESSFG